MRIPSWLRQTVADFFRVESDEDDAEAERARRELEEARSLALLAVAQARRTELELRDVLAAGASDPTRLAELVPRLEEERGRAGNLMADYRHREDETAARMTRLGNVRLAEELNERREELREAMDAASRAGRDEQLAQTEDEARTDAYRLDVLDRLDAGDGWSRESAASERDAGGEAELIARAQQLLAEESHEEQ